MTPCCNRCRAEISEGAPRYRGELTPAVWCQPCADELFHPTDEAFAGLDKRKLAKAFPEFTEAMRALKARAAMKVTRTVVIGGEE
jgi:hypothetical protein